MEQNKIEFSLRGTTWRCRLCCNYNLWYI